MDADGKVIALLWVGPFGDYALTVGRFLATGAVDTAFGPNADGMGEWTEVDLQDAPEAVLLRSDGKIMLVGLDAVANETILARYTVD